MSLPLPSNRAPEHAVDPQFPNRWSPRAMSGEEIPLEELNTLFEAARWAPSSGNGQPWRFVFARRGTPAWDTFVGLLTEGNRVWAHKASALVATFSRLNSERSGKPNSMHAHDTGAAWMNLALQGALRGLVVHGMGGFDRERAVKELGVPEGYAPQTMIAIGRYGDPGELPEDKRAGETPSTRKPLSELVFEGRWPEGME